MMISRLKKRIFASSLATTLIITMIPSWVLAKEEAVSEENLRKSVANKIDSLDFEHLVTGMIINNINTEVTNRVIESINKCLTKEDIEVLIELQIEEIFKMYRKDVSLDKIIANDIVSKIMTSDFLEEIIERTIEYSVLKAMDSVKISLVKENVKGGKLEIINSIVNEIFNSKKATEFRI